ncbi:hypothetical protein [Nitrospirillum sp. BR 11163]|uniref:hypothetical protein n=1 Tax=Nitrospirillum sp. BR 11163 TaxID=3104323 RepID=UPI002AFEC74F|nr:hypothetical protein [Nitrospirillum sp. BR 11163]MEA1674366.1 hypothetical protein [Nitrospirillum sp. BR 11163]
MPKKSDWDKMTTDEKLKNLKKALDRLEELAERQESALDQITSQINAALSVVTKRLDDLENRCPHHQEDKSHPTS